MLVQCYKERFIVKGGGNWRQYQLLWENYITLSYKLRDLVGNYEKFTIFFVKSNELSTDLVNHNSKLNCKTFAFLMCMRVCVCLCYFHSDLHICNMLSPLNTYWFLTLHLFFVVVVVVLFFVSEIHSQLIVCFVSIYSINLNVETMFQFIFFF